MDDNHYDHEQLERDHYDRESFKLLEGRVKLVKLFVIILLLISLLLLLPSCISTQPPATRTTGTVLEVAGDLVMVAFPVVNKESFSHGSNWFYAPGHSYQVRDMFPDPAKDPDLAAKLQFTYRKSL